MLDVGVAEPFAVLGDSRTAAPRKPTGSSLHLNMGEKVSPLDLLSFTPELPFAITT